MGIFDWLGKKVPQKENQCLLDEANKTSKNFSNLGNSVTREVLKEVNVTQMVTGLELSLF